MQHPVFIEGAYDTGFIADHMGESFEAAPDEEAERVAYTMAAIAAYRAEKAKASRGASSSGDGDGNDGQWRNAGRRAQMRGGLR